MTDLPKHAASRSPDALVPEVYAELRRLAGRYVARERAVSIAATELVHDAYLRMANTFVEFNDRSHFVAIAAISMRRLLVERARARAASKRGGGEIRVTFDEMQLPGTPPALDVTALDAALTKLATIIPPRRGLSNSDSSAASASTKPAKRWASRPRP